MRSGGYGNMDNASQKALQTAGNMVKKGVSNAGRTARKGLKKTGKMVKKGIKRGANSKSFSNTISGIIKIAIFAACFLFFMTICYECLNVDGGETDEYIGGGNAVIGGSENENIRYTNANAACKAYYSLISRYKTVWQETLDGTLIRPTDENAVHDYFHNDEKFYVEADLLFSMNKFIFGDTNVFPEAFTKPVAYDKTTHELLDITDENGKVVVTSGIVNSVADYGIASVLTYKDVTRTITYEGVYISKDYINENGDLVKDEACNEPYSVIGEVKTEHVLDKAVTYRGTFTYNYTETKSDICSVYDGESDNEASNERKILYATGICNVYYVKHPNGAVKEFMSYDDAYSFWTRARNAGWYIDSVEVLSGETETFLETEGLLFSEETSENSVYAGLPENRKPKIGHKSVALYKYRDPSVSGQYETFVSVDMSTENEERNNDYLRDYLKNFSTYQPKNTSHGYEILQGFTSQADVSNFSYVARGGSALDGNSVYTTSNEFNDVYNNPVCRENMEKIWDGLIQWGYSEEQTAAILGSIICESRCLPDAENNDQSLSAADRGAYGLIQIHPTGNPIQYKKLETFATSRGVEKSDLDTQIMFVAMCADINNKYSQANCQWDNYKNATVKWGNKTVKDFWNSESDVLLLARTWRLYAEIPYQNINNWRPDDKIMTIAENAAVACYDTYKGRSVMYTIEVIVPDGGTALANSDPDIKINAITGELNETDLAAFSKFYHAFDDIYDGETDLVLSYYAKPLTDKEIDEVYYTANMYIFNTDLETQRRKSKLDSHEISYLSDLTDRTAVKYKTFVIEGSLDSPRLSAEFAVYHPQGQSHPLTIEEVRLNRWYLGIDEGGENVYTGTVGLVSNYEIRGKGNCTAYAYGRFSEIMGEQMAGGNHGHAKSFYSHANSVGVYETGLVPKVGAIICWGSNSINPYGHVAVIEVITEDGKYITSQSGYNSGFFYNKIYSSREEMESAFGPLQGYIYPYKKISE